MALEAAELVRAAMKAAGIPEDKPTELARRIGLSAYDSPKRVKRWLDGENAPRYNETIALLELAGWLNMSGGRRKAQAAPDDPLAALEATVELMADRTGAALEKLQADVTELSARIPPAASRRRKAG